jgi:hypothetical protein
VVVAAALAVVLLAASACGPLPPQPSPSLPGVTPSPAAPPPSERPAGHRLLVADGIPDNPQVRVHDPANPSAPSAALPLPDGLESLAALAASGDGRVALVAPDGRTWIAAVDVDRGTVSPWQTLPPLSPEGGLPGEILGTAWGITSTTVFLTVADTLAGTARTLVVARPLDGSPERYVELPLVPDGPGLAVLPDERVALAARDETSRSHLTIVEVSGAFAVLGVRARGVAIGGDLLAVVQDLEEVFIGKVAGLARGVGPTDRLPLDGDLGVDSIAIASDGSAIAVLRLDADLTPVRIDVLTRRGGTWMSLGNIPVAPGRGGVTIAWLSMP